MPKKGFTEEQITYARRQAEAGAPVLEVCRKLGVTKQTFYRWNRKFAGLGVAELQKLRQGGGREPQAQAARRRSHLGQAHTPSSAV